MKNFAYKKPLIFLVILYLTAILPVFGFGVKYGDEFLRFGTGVRENSLGGAAVSSSEPVVGAYWNPALVSQTKRFKAQIMHSEEFAGVVNNDHFFVNVPGKRNLNFAAGFFRTGVDNIPATANTLIEYGTENGQLDAGDRIDYDKISYFNASESAFFLSAARPISNNLAVGATFKTIHKNLYEQYAWGFGLDAGIFYQPLENLQTGAVLRNITTTFLFWNDGEREIIKPSLAVGGSYGMSINSLKLKIRPMVGLDMDLEGEQNNVDLNLQTMNVRLRSGLEIVYNQLIAIRAGRDDLGSFHLGCGLKTPYGNLDYGFAMGQGYSDLGNSHRLGLTLDIRAIQNFITE